MSRFYNKEGKIINIVEWGKLFSDMKYRVIDQEFLPDKKWISTIWLGIDHQFGKGPPLIFETMVFPKKSSWDELDCDRYATLTKAKRGHKRMVKKWLKKMEVK